MIIGIIFSVAFPEVAQTINDAIMPTIQSISEKMINWITKWNIGWIIFSVWWDCLHVYYSMGWGWRYTLSFAYL